MKVSPSVTERREATSRVPYRKVLRAKPTLGHTPTHKPGQRKHPRHPQALSRPHRPSRYHRDREGHHDSNPDATGRHVTTASLSSRQRPLSRPQPRRDKVALDRGDASTDADRGMLHPGPPKTIQTPTHGEGSMGKAVKLTTKPRGLPIHPDWEGHKKSLPFMKNEPTRGPSRRLATSSSLHARSTTPRYHAWPSSSPETLKG
ncbi:hypothetical protein Taro_016144 [Colocasia esculenta]|uniref:Uncharacterized protein n=1 Tax=Colocasia esculenta TaxID=4460 RepID=A0A843US40_COLES|nr:hypothetical protein [Colocasia esculenta]